MSPASSSSTLTQEDSAVVVTVPATGDKPAKGNVPAAIAWAKERAILPNIFTRTHTATVLATSIMVAMYMFLYISMVWDPMSHMNQVRVGFVNADAGFNFSGYPAALAPAVLAQTGGSTMGQVLEKLMLDPSSPAATPFIWESLSGVSHSEIVDRVDKNEFWNVIYVPADFSNSFLRNFDSGKPRTDLVFMNVENIYDQARQGTVTSFSNNLLAVAVKKANAVISAQTLAAFNTNATLGSPVFPPTIQVVANNLHPVSVFGRNMAINVMSLLLWLSGIMTFAIVSGAYRSRLPVLRERGHIDHLRTPLRLISSIYTASLLISFMHAFVVWCLYCAFNGSVTGGFNADYSPVVALLILWYITFCFHSIAILLSSIIPGVGFAVILAILMIFQMSFSSLFSDPDVMIGIGQISHGLPMQNAARTFKCLLLGSSCSFMPKNLGVLAAWWAVTTLIACTVNYRRMVKLQNSPTGKHDNGSEADVSADD
ncbi:hypothetical protein HK105_200328 [Polyrhizophydium stewartii]|uniref:DUF3533 domain-containing protein n=1 Tax=Polyrhizophydium stewartii TaxID=2732419 RepID=A0ABR4NL49_9FUNG|nr:hypothetical protein HK105_005000 [Polyrhizophydium stewartii]